MTFENYNDYIRWDKEATCHAYSITNLTPPAPSLEGFPVRVDIYDLTQDDNGLVRTPIYTIESLSAGATVLWTAPSDGVYEFCAAPLVDTIVSSTDAGFTRARRTWVTLTGALNTDQLLTVSTSVGVVGVGAPLSLFLPNGGTVIGVNALLASNGGGACFVIPPNVTLAGYPHTPSSSWTFVIDSLANVTITAVGYQANGSTTSTSTVNSACLYAFNDSPVPTVQQHYITSLLVGTTNILTRYYDKRYELNVFYNDVTTWLQANGGGGVYIGQTGDPYIYSLTCQNFQQLTSSEIQTIQQLTLCAYIIDLCDLTSCMDKLIREWLCGNPCCEDCDSTEQAKRNKARENALWLSRMFYIGLQPLITKDTLFYLGSWTQEEQRIVRTTKITELYTKIRKFLEQCDLCPKPDTCRTC